TTPTTEGGGLTLSEALAQLGALQRPEGVDAAAFAGLKEAFAESLRSTGQSRFTSALPPGDFARVTDLSLSAGNPGQIVLGWTYRNRGDYDQNSETNINDLSALGANLGKTTSSPDWLTRAVVADGDSNGEVNISDITPIGGNFLGRVDGYRIEASSDPVDESSWIQIAQVTHAEGVISGGDPHLQFIYTLSQPAGPTSFRVTPLFESEAGSASNIVSFDPGQVPVIDDVTPQNGTEGEALEFSATLSGGAVDTYSWSFGGGATPDISTEAAPTVTLGAPANYSASLTVTNGAGSDTFDFTLTVTPSGSVNIEDVTPTSGETGTLVVFTPVISGNEDTWFWEFGGAAFPAASVQESPTVTLQDVGQHTIELTATDSVSGDSDTFSFTFEVVASTQPPAVDDVNPKNGSAGTDVTFNATLSGTPPDTYAWDFGGGATPNTSSDLAPTVTMGSPGTYQASLTVSNLNGSDVFDFDLNVVDGNTAPDVQFVFPNNAAEGSTFTFDVTMSGGTPTTILWTFPNDLFTISSSTELEPTVTCNGGPNIGIITLYVENAGGKDPDQPDGYSFPFTVDPAP
ncbi:MAG: PKD domain-containing protein, partial [bacterium]|nr:PKD domain-containing protein [bacterium]